MKFATLGMGSMGVNMSLLLQSKGHSIIAWNRSEERRKVARDAGLWVADELYQIAHELQYEERKIVMMFITAGAGIDELLFAEGALRDSLPEGSIIIDCANSHYRDSQRRAAELAHKHISFLDCGVSGGVWGARNGASLMIGGNEEAYQYTEEIFKSASKPNGYNYFGKSGAGHYVKMVHNGIEYAMMQGIAEGMNLIEKSDFDINFSQLIETWNNGSIIESSLLSYMKAALDKDPQLTTTPDKVGGHETGRWAVEDAMHRGVPVTNMANAVMSRYQSQDKDSFLYKALQAMRKEFGGHGE